MAPHKKRQGGQKLNVKECVGGEVQCTRLVCFNLHKRLSNFRGGGGTLNKTCSIYMPVPLMQFKESAKDF